MLNQPRTRSWTFFVLALVAVLALILHESGQLAPIEDLAQYIIAPIQRSFDSLVDTTGNTFGAFRDTQALRAENRQLQAENNQLRTDNVRLKEFEAENATLRDLLQFSRNTPNYDMLAADVIGRDPSPYLGTITINIGDNRNVKPGMPVITSGSALIGRVMSVSPRTSKVQLLQDVASAVNGVTQSNRASGLVRGQPDGSLIMDLIPLGETVLPGDIVLTSGLGGDLPRSLVIGQVEEATRRDIDLFQTAVIRAAADLSRLEVVMVISNFEGAEK